MTERAGFVGDHAADRARLLVATSGRSAGRAWPPPRSFIEHDAGLDDGGPHIGIDGQDAFMSASSRG
jgi:hypothetical protein